MQQQAPQHRVLLLKIHIGKDMFKTTIIKCSLQIYNKLGKKQNKSCERQANNK
jgi:hypothetical protein